MQTVTKSKFVSTILFIYFTAFSNVACMGNNYISYRPIYRQKEGLVISEAPISDQLKVNIKKVFKYYDVPYKEDNKGNILIPHKISANKELIWNYTTKANDPQWLKTHSDR
ncbi:MAG: hypothetical protein AAF208_01065 [Cyanobacteria bacterium P01_A01_bin.45]